MACKELSTPKHLSIQKLNSECKSFDWCDSMFPRFNTNIINSFVDMSYGLSKDFGFYLYNVACYM
jgi:hypothetical protein